MPDAETGRRYVDKLVKVWRKDGIEEWVLIHIEVQHNTDEGFPRRMFVYYYRLLDRYQRKVASVAVLGDDDAKWRPGCYNDELWECRLAFQFPVVKLLDWSSNVNKLEADANPFAVVVLADLKARETRKDPLTRKEWKFRIVRGLYERGMGRNEIQQLFRFIEWVMELPEPLAQAFDQELTAYEKEKAMPFVTGIERRALEKGKVEGKIEGKIEGKVESLLETIEALLGRRFDTSGLALMPSIRKIDDPGRLKDLVIAIATASTADDIAKMLS